MTIPARSRRSRLLLALILGLLARPCFLARRGLLVAATATISQPVHAISGGGKDYASSTLTQSFKGGNYDKKDFSGCVANNLDFTESTFRGCRFYKADLGGSNFEKSDLTGASLEGANLDDVNFDGANLEGAYFTNTILQAKSLKGALFTEALLPADAVQKLCERPDVQASEATRESIPCP
ncbi:Thylakoid lumenal 15 kDa protein 1 [Durusdinium trenchii]|uniref:Chloroplastic (p15) n=1 Tax=Durusdinium trenchii TaxID=1381693 RepID=A0ABP0QF70_9DINO